MEKISPQFEPETGPNPQPPTDETVIQHGHKEGENKWGPVQAFRKSSRVEVGGRTMLEIAINTKKVHNLEATKNDTKGTIVKNSFELFSNPNFLEVAKKIGIEVDTSYNSTVEASSSSSLPLSEGQNAGEFEQFNAGLNSSAVDKQKSKMDVFCNITQLVEKPEGPPDISSLIDYPRLTKKPGQRSLEGKDEFISELHSMFIDDHPPTFMGGTSI